MSPACLLLGLLILGAGAVDAGDAKPIKVNIYYETDCPFCRRFVANVFGKMPADCVQNVTQFDWIPYGNAGVLDTGDPRDCQHGEDECFGNRLHMCARDKYWKGEKLDRWVTCVMRNLLVQGRRSRDRESYEPCDPDAADELMQCAESPRGLGLLKMVGTWTKSIRLHHVPWIGVKGDLYKNLQGNFIKGLCGKMAQLNLGQPQCCVEQAAAATPFGRRLLV